MQYNIVRYVFTCGLVGSESSAAFMSLLMSLVSSMTHSNVSQ